MKNKYLPKYYVDVDFKFDPGYIQYYNNFFEAIIFYIIKNIKIRFYALTDYHFKNAKIKFGIN